MDTIKGDEVDIANARVELEIQAALAAHRTKERQVLPEIGRCHYCNTTVAEGLYCDDECNSEHIEELRKLDHLNKIAGGSRRVTYGA